jgi:hypothetical protein
MALYIKPSDVLFEGCAATIFFTCVQETKAELSAEITDNLLTIELKLDSACSEAERKSFESLYLRILAAIRRA